LLYAKEWEVNGLVNISGIEAQLFSARGVYQRLARSGQIVPVFEQVQFSITEHQ
jgi:hypothetical protein